MGSCIGTIYSICYDSNNCSYCNKPIQTSFSYNGNYYCSNSCKETERSNILRSSAYRFPV